MDSSSFGSKSNFYLKNLGPVNLAGMSFSLERYRQT
jgi:hypothetical protein